MEIGQDDTYDETIFGENLTMIIMTEFSGGKYSEFPVRILPVHIACEVP